MRTSFIRAGLLAAAPLAVAATVALAPAAAPAFAGTGPVITTNPSPIPDQSWIIGQPIPAISFTASPSGPGCTVIKFQTGFTGLPNGITQTSQVNPGGSITVTLGGTAPAINLFTGTLMPTSAQTCNGSGQLPTNGTPFNFVLSTPFQATFQNAGRGDLEAVSPTFPGATSLNATVAAGTSPASTYLAGAGGYATAFVNAADGDLDITSTGFGFTGDTGQQVAPGTSPAITALPGGGYQAAYHGANGDLWFTGTGPHTRNGDSGVLIAAGSSPSISALPDGGYETAANDGASLYLVAAPGTADFSGPINGIPIQPGTSPAVAGLANGGWQVAVNLDANNGHTLYLQGSGAPGTLTENTGVAAAAGSSPAITTTTTGWESAINDGASLYLVGTDFSGPINGIPAAPGTSPAIAGPSGGGWQAAVHLDANNNGTLYLTGSGAPGTQIRNTGIALAAGTSPAITFATGSNP